MQITAIKNRVLIPATIAAAVLLSSQSIKAQSTQTDTVEIAKTEQVADKTAKKEKPTWETALGIAFLAIMGAMGLGHYFTKSGDEDTKDALNS